MTVSPGETFFECGGLSPTLWWIAGVALVSAAIVAHALLRRHGRRLPPLSEA